MKKLAIASAIALLGMGAAHAQEIVILTPQPQVAGVFQAGNGVDADVTIDNIAGVTAGLLGGGYDVDGPVPVGGGLLSTMLKTEFSYTDEFERQYDNGIGEDYVEIDRDIQRYSTGYDIAVISGAVNLARINGAIDISGTSVTLSSLANNVSASATATAETSTADAYAIAGVKLETTVIGALNSSTVEVMGKLTEQSNSFTQTTGLASLAAQGQSFDMESIDVDAAALPNGNELGIDLESQTLFGSAPNFDNILGANNGQFDLAGLSSEITATTTNMVSELQNMAVFNSAINAAALDAGIKVVASVDPSAWFLNPQTGGVNLSNVSMATTAIGALNSGITRLGANLTPTVTVK